MLRLDLRSFFENRPMNFWFKLFRPIPKFICPRTFGIILCAITFFAVKSNFHRF